MIKKIIILLKLARKIAKSDALKVISKTHEPPFLIKLIASIFSFSFSKDSEYKMNSTDEERLCSSIEKMGTTDTLGYYLPHGPDWLDNATEELGYDMADCWASCMILFDWGLQYDPRGYIFVSEMVTGIYVIQYDGDKHPDYVFPPLFNA